MVGAAGIEPATTCSQSRCAASALHSDMAVNTMLTAPGRGSTVREVTCRKFLAVAPMATASPRREVKTDCLVPHKTDTSRPQSR